jgi:hypothetical protein
MKRDLNIQRKHESFSLIHRNRKYLPVGMSADSGAKQEPVLRSNKEILLPLSVNLGAAARGMLKPNRYSFGGSSEKLGEALDLYTRR